MSTELEPAPADDPMADLPVVWKFAQRVAKTEFVPQALRGRPDAVLAAIQYGRELGIGPMQSLQSFDVIQGKPTLKPEAMRARVRAAGHSIVVQEKTVDTCKMLGRRGDNGDSELVVWTMVEARAAGLTNKDSWKKYPKAMLLARATAELCRSLFPDVISGASYTSEELGDDPADDVIDVEEVESAGGDVGDGGGGLPPQDGPSPSPAFIEPRGKGN